MQKHVIDQCYTVNCKFYSFRTVLYILMFLSLLGAKQTVEAHSVFLPFLFFLLFIIISSIFFWLECLCQPQEPCGFLNEQTDWGPSHDSFHQDSCLHLELLEVLIFQKIIGFLRSGRVQCTHWHQFRPYWIFWHIGFSEKVKKKNTGHKLCAIFTNVVTNDGQTKPQKLSDGFLLCESVRPSQPIKIGGEVAKQ